MKKISAKDVLVSPACFRQRVSLPVAQVAGLSESELATALAFEIEPFSGIPQAEGELAWQPLEENATGRRGFDVVQIRKTDLAEAVAQARATGRKVTAVTAPPEEARGETTDNLPHIRVPARSVLMSHPYLIWTAICLLVAACLGYEGLQLRSETAELRQEVEARRTLQTEKNSLEAKAARLRREADDLRRQHEETAQAQERIARLRGAGRRLLEAVPEAYRDTSVVRGIHSTEDGLDLTLAGVALSPEAAAHTLTRLTQTLEGSGWQVKPGAVGTRATGDSCIFDCTCTFAEGKEATP